MTQAVKFNTIFQNSDLTAFYFLKFLYVSNTIAPGAVIIPVIDKYCNEGHGYSVNKLIFLAIGLYNQQYMVLVCLNYMSMPVHYEKKQNSFISKKSNSDLRFLICLTHRKDRKDQRNWDSFFLSDHSPSVTLIPRIPHLDSTSAEEDKDYIL